MLSTYAYSENLPYRQVKYSFYNKEVEVLERLILWRRKRKPHLLLSMHSNYKHCHESTEKTTTKNIKKPCDHPSNKLLILYCNELTSFVFRLLMCHKFQHHRVGLYYSAEAKLKHKPNSNAHTRNN